MKNFQSERSVSYLKARKNSSIESKKCSDFKRNGSGLRPSQRINLNNTQKIELPKKSPISKMLVNLTPKKVEVSLVNQSPWSVHMIMLEKAVKRIKESSFDELSDIVEGS